MIAAIVFDFDGVIADSEVLHLRAYQQVLAPLGIPLAREDYYSTYLGFDDDGVFRAVGDAQGLTLDDTRVAALIAEKARVFDALQAEGEVLFPTAAACIRRLAAAYPLGIASGARRDEIEHVLERAGLADAFRFIVAAGETPRSKPSPDPYRRAAELHGLDPAACLAIEDSHWGIVSAKAAGLSCVAVTTTYGASSLGAADAVVPSLDVLDAAFVRDRFKASSDLPK